jgi:hypothetical protein
MSLKRTAIQLNLHARNVRNALRQRDSWARRTVLRDEKV